MSPDLRIVLDENLPWPVADELLARGYRADSVHALGFVGNSDPELLAQLAKLPGAAVLVTFDNRMPVDHRAAVETSGLALAVIAAVSGLEGPAVAFYHRDVIHRHAHRFASQTPGSLWTYRRGGRRPIRLAVG